MAQKLKDSGTYLGFTKSCTVLDTDPICPSPILLMPRLGNKLIFTEIVVVDADSTKRTENR